MAQHGPASVTMSQIAQSAGIGRATLYKYFPDVGAILTAWHERQIRRHLEQLTEARDRARGAARRLEAVFEAYAAISHQQGAQQHEVDPELVAALHRGAHVDAARQELHGLVRELLNDAAEAGLVRDDIDVDELASYCLHALAAAGSLPSRAAVRRLVGLVVGGLQPPG